eukprot:TRINITY_DN36687_c0_g1_i1.p1 TRINITY_DN36687_c0_g1~~TRINITY_DN36687_c0_g1_i1.p1  ORF type:complete len:739 (+),score=87.40 TRINITY_DN36687_c0_g1_i1:94-2217(+)
MAACQSVSELAKRYAVNFTAVARLRRLRNELMAVRSAHEELAAKRVQRWFRIVRWRTRTLPLQLIRARVLLRSCRVIQHAWRKAFNAAAVETTHNASATAPCWNVGLSDSEDEIDADIADSAASISSFRDGTVNKGNAVGFYDASCKTESGAAGVRTVGLGQSPSRTDANISAGVNSESPHALSGSRHESPRVVIDPRLVRAAACWRGSRVRRALAAKTVQTKVQLWHDLYQLISDVEWQRDDSGLPDQRAVPWLDVLYSSLGRLQQEVLQEFWLALLDGRGMLSLAGPSSGARGYVIWKGWHRDLQRLPWLMVEGFVGTYADREQDFSNDPFADAELSLINSTVLQTCSMPVISEAAKPRQLARAATEAGTVLHKDGGASGCKPRPCTSSWSQVRPRVRCWDTPSSQLSNVHSVATDVGKSLPLLRRNASPSRRSRPGLGVGGEHQVSKEPEFQSLGASGSSRRQTRQSARGVGGVNGVGSAVGISGCSGVGGGVGSGVGGGNLESDEAPSSSAEARTNRKMPTEMQMSRRLSARGNGPVVPAPAKNIMTNLDRSSHSARSPVHSSGAATSSRPKVGVGSTSTMSPASSHSFQSCLGGGGSGNTGDARTPVAATGVARRKKSQHMRMKPGDLDEDLANECRPHTAPQTCVDPAFAVLDSARDVMGLGKPILDATMASPRHADASVIDVNAVSSPSKCEFYVLSPRP